MPSLRSDLSQDSNANEQVFFTKLVKYLDTNKNIIYKSPIFAAMIMAMAFLLWPCDASAIGQNRKTEEIKVDTAVFMRQAKELEEVVVRPKKEKYTKKGNPAVELMERIRHNQQKGDPRKMENYSYDQYDKTTLGLLDFPENILEKRKFLKDYVDTSAYGNRPVLDILIKERGATQVYRNMGKDKKTLVTGRKSNGIDEVLDADNVTVMLEDVLRDVDIYGNDIILMQNRFVSPLSAIGADYYKYFITDTLDVEGTRCVQLTFSPRNPESFSFMGNLYVALGDTTGFVRKVSMKVPRTLNLNYVDNLYIDQVFEQDSLGKRHKTVDDMSVDICLIKGTQTFYGRRTTRYGRFGYDERQDDLSGYVHQGEVYEKDDSGIQPALYWDEIRMTPLTHAESGMEVFMKKMREVPLLYWTEKVLAILVNGYIKTGKDSKFDIGPVNTMISFNTVEGIRLRFGGMTTANLSPQWFARGYGAYGCKDHKWKYKGELEYSFNRKKYHSREFPVKSIRGTYMYDLDMIGQHYLFTNADNIFLSWKRKPSDLVTYRRLARLDYNLELGNNLSFDVWGEHVRQEGTRWLPFIDGYGNPSKSYRRTTFGVTVRYAPGEKFVQEKSLRLPVNMDAPVFQLTQEWGPKGDLGSDFSLCRTELSIQKRFWFSAFGYADVILKGVKIWSQVQYPVLAWPNANLSYTIQPESYSLMNPMEFAMDQSASVDVTYWGNGVLFNRLPLIKKAKLREVIGFKGLLGSLSKKNDPALHDNLFRFPSDADAMKMGKTPYMEFSAGIDNIFTILRVDYVRRLSYRDTPGCDRDGVRISLHFTF